MPEDLTDTWRVCRVGGALGMQTRVKVYAPGCPAAPHAERYCRCRTFNDWRRAYAYVEEQSRATQA